MMRGQIIIQKYKTIFVGNLAPEASYQVDLDRHFHNLGAGAIEEVRIQREKGFGFVRYNNQSEASLAIQVGNARILWEAYQGLASQVSMADLGLFGLPS
ncbi:oligouridylate-binding protein 1-like [Iris pallida]|uniref:Oligouridylate-binding protein 1-like n=1 Tax=Iris pallida TaxID=29817 RepID=A0AAX6F082_IRIPA|nr:oligouridylate-binding protein 1-like [Iris pallida]